MPKFLMGVTLNQEEPIVARLGSGTGSANWFTDTEEDKAVKMVGDSQFALCAIGDPIEGFVSSVNTAPADNYSVGGVQLEDRMWVTAEGSQAAGTGNLAVGDYVVAGTNPAIGTRVPDTGPNVRKATNQPFAAITVPDNLQASINTALASVIAQMKTMQYGWKVISLGSAGTGAVGTQVLIERQLAP